MQSDQCPLEDIVSLRPPAEAWMAVKHLSGEFEQAVAGMMEQRLFGCRVTCEGLIKQPLQLGI